MTMTLSQIKRKPDGPPQKLNGQQCYTCSRPTSRECSHVECPNRRAVTAQPSGNAWHFQREAERGAWE